MSHAKPKTFVTTTKFDRQAKKLQKELITSIDWATVLTCLAKGTPLPEKYKDHQLKGEWKDFRDCHIKPDLLLLYTYPNEETVFFVQIGSHSELF